MGIFNKADQYSTTTVPASETTIVASGAKIEGIFNCQTRLHVDGEIIGTYGRLFLTEEGISELISNSGIRLTYTPLYEAPKTASTFLRRSGYGSTNYYGATSNGGNGPRGYRTF